MNWATLSAGAAVVSVSSEVAGCEAHHVLTDDVSQIWLSDTGIPQWICISLQNISDYQNVEIRTVGWHCWHSYSTNPREVRIHVSRDGAKFRIWDTVSAAVQHQGTQLFCCAPISVALYPFIAFEILTTYGGPQTYMNRIYLYSDEFSPDSVASVSEYERSSLNITMGGIKSADTSTLDDDESHAEDFRPSGNRYGNQPLTQYRQPQFNPSNVSAEILDPSHSGRFGMPSTIKQTSPVFQDPRLRDDYVAVLQSYDAYSNSLKSLNEDTTVLVDRLSKALGIEDAQDTAPSSIPSTDDRSNNQPSQDAHLVAMPRNGGMSPRSSYYQKSSNNTPAAPHLYSSLRNNADPYFRSPAHSTALPTRMWQSDTAALLSRRTDPSVGDVTGTSMTEPNELSQQRVESLLTSHDGQLYYSARKPTVNTDITGTSAAGFEESTMASLLNIPQKDVDSVLLSTTIQSQQRSQQQPLLKNASVNASSHPLSSSINNSHLRLSSGEIDDRLKNLEDKFQTIVGLLEHKNATPSQTLPTIRPNSTENQEKETDRKEHRRHRSRSHSRQRRNDHRAHDSDDEHDDDDHRRSKHRDHSRSRSRSHSHRFGHHHDYSPSPSRSRSHSRSRNSGQHHRHHDTDVYASSRDASRGRGRKTSRSNSRSRSHSNNRHNHKHSSKVASYHYNIDDDSSSRSGNSRFSLSGPISPSRDDMDTQNNKLKSKENNHSNNKNNNDSTRANTALEAVSVTSVSSDDTSSTNNHSATDSTATVTTSTSSVLRNMLGKHDGEGVDQLVSRILREVKQHGHLSEHAAAMLRRQSLPVPVTAASATSYMGSARPHQDNIPADFVDLLPTAKTAVLASAHSSPSHPSPIDTTRILPNSRSSPTHLLSHEARNLLDQRSIVEQEAQVAVQRVLDRRYPFPTAPGSHLHDHYHSIIAPTKATGDTISLNVLNDNIHQLLRKQQETLRMHPSSSLSSSVASSLQDTADSIAANNYSITNNGRKLRDDNVTVEIKDYNNYSDTRPFSSRSIYLENQNNYNLDYNYNSQYNNSSTSRTDSTGDVLAQRIDQLVKDLHNCVLQKTMKEAQLRILRGEDPTPPS